MLRSLTVFCLAISEEALSAFHLILYFESLKTSSAQKKKSSAACHTLFFFAWESLRDTVSLQRQKQDSSFVKKMVQKVNTFISTHRVLNIFKSFFKFIFKWSYTLSKLSFLCVHKALFSVHCIYHAEPFFHIINSPRRTEPSVPPANWRESLFLREALLGLFSCRYSQCDKRRKGWAGKFIRLYHNVRERIPLSTGKLPQHKLCRFKTKTRKPPKVGLALNYVALNKDKSCSSHFLQSAVPHQWLG